MRRARRSGLRKRGTREKSKTCPPPTAGSGKGRAASQKIKRRGQGRRGIPGLSRCFGLVRDRKSRGGRNGAAKRGDDTKATKKSREKCKVSSRQLTNRATPRERGPTKRQEVWWGGGKQAPRARGEESRPHLDLKKMRGNPTRTVVGEQAVEKGEGTVSHIKKAGSSARRRKKNPGKKKLGGGERGGGSDHLQRVRNWREDDRRVPVARKKQR